ncbi:MAG: ISKra4 family transposase [Actinomycetota bacterium]|nr:ISKra4 family transposase [Actinomycetota bacterium]
MSAATGGDSDGFGESRTSFEGIVGWLNGDGAVAMAHGEIEAEINRRSRDLMRQMFQDHLDARAAREERLEVVDAEGVARGSVEVGHGRGLATIFGAVRVERLAYRQRGEANLHPADAVLNLPQERHSHGLRLVAAVESSRGSFDAAAEAIERGCGQSVGKRQVEALAAAAAADFEEFYTTADPGTAEPGDVVVLTCDGKGIVMRSGELRPETAKAAAKTTDQPGARLGKHEKRNRKRMAEVGAVYEITPARRAPADIWSPVCDDTTAAPKAANKWVTASVVEDAAVVIATVFDEAERRDPRHQRQWVALVDGNAHQIERINAEAAARGVTVPILIDFLHVLEYVWGAARSLFGDGDPAADKWAHDTASGILDGKARQVAASIRSKATRAKLAPAERKGADECAKYLTNKAAYLNYPEALSSGWPIATGVIEGTCRYLVADRMDITGARWSVQGAEAILKLRALRTNGDWPEYWRYHLAKERQRVHESRYATNIIPKAA